MLCEKHKKIEGSKLSFRDILFDGNNWEAYVAENNPPYYLIEAVEKLRKCRTGELGYHFWYCENCGKGGRSPHSCKSKLCSSCATIATNKWLAEMLPNLLNIKYFQIVFTLPPKLYPIFTTNKKTLYNLFFKIASQTLLLVGETMNLEPGIAGVFHPFGSSYNIHPHIHFMATAGGLTLNRKGWFPITSWPLELTRDIFKALLYRELRKLVKTGKLFNPHQTYAAFNAILKELYPKAWNMFIGYKDQQDTAKFGLGYISRYAKRAIISDRKLLAYDGTTVTFKSKDKNLTVNKNEFIRNVLRHVMPKHFKMTRFYGIYSNRKRKTLVPLAKKLARAEGIKVAKFKDWRARRKQYSGKDPLLCPNCGTKMTLIAVTHSARTPTYLVGIIDLSIFEHFL